MKELFTSWLDAQFFCTVFRMLDSNAFVLLEGKVSFLQCCEINCYNIILKIHTLVYRDNCMMTAANFGSTSGMNLVQDYLFVQPIEGLKATDSRSFWELGQFEWPRTAQEDI